MTGAEESIEEREGAQRRAKAADAGADLPRIAGVEPYASGAGWVLYCGNNADLLPGLAGAGVHACVTDPPYGLRFMDRRWDYSVPTVAQWAAVLACLLPGAHVAMFGGSRTYHRAVVALEDAGADIRDTLMWLYGSGFPKSHDVGKAIDRAAGAERAETSRRDKGQMHGGAWGGEHGFAQMHIRRDAPATEAAAAWQGWGTALKPAHEPICLARRPLAGTVAANVLAHGVGGLNIDACRVPCAETPAADRRKGAPPVRDGLFTNRITPARYAEPRPGEQTGRWPPNLLHDGSAEVLAVFPDTAGGHGNATNSKDDSTTVWFSGGYAGHRRPRTERDGLDQQDTAARFFPSLPIDEPDAPRALYCPKAARSERDDGCEEFGMRQAHKLSGGECVAEGRTAAKGKAVGRNHHETVKPLRLCAWLVRLITPPGGLVLDPWAGSGSVGVAALAEGMRYIGIELDPEHCAIAAARLAEAERRGIQLGLPL